MFDLSQGQLVLRGLLTMLIAGGPHPMVGARSRPSCHIHAI